MAAQLTGYLRCVLVRKGVECRLLAHRDPAAMPSKADKTKPTLMTLGA